MGKKNKKTFCCAHSSRLLKTFSDLCHGALSNTRTVGRITCWATSSIHSITISLLIFCKVEYTLSSPLRLNKPKKLATLVLELLIFSCSPIGAHPYGILGTSLKLDSSVKYKSSRPCSSKSSNCLSSFFFCLYTSGSGSFFSHLRKRFQLYLSFLKNVSRFFYLNQGPALILPVLKPYSNS